MQQHPSSSMPPGIYVRATQICSRPGRPGILPISESTWYRWIADGVVPAGSRIGPGTVVWPLSLVISLGSGAANESSTREAA